MMNQHYHHEYQHHQQQPSQKRKKCHHILDSHSGEEGYQDEGRHHHQQQHLNHQQQQRHNQQEERRCSFKRMKRRCSGNPCYVSLDYTDVVDYDGVDRRCHNNDTMVNNICNSNCDDSSLNTGIADRSSDKRDSSTAATIKIPSSNLILSSPEESSDHCQPQHHQQQQQQVEEKVVDIKEVIQKVNNWLLNDGSDYYSMTDFITNYVKVCLHENNIPVDRFYIGSNIVHAQANAWTWTYELDKGGVSEAPVPRVAGINLGDVVSNDARIRREDLLNKEVNGNSSTAVVNDETRRLFEKCGYNDMYSKCKYRRNKFNKGFTWSTKSSKQFTEDHITFFNETLSILSNVVELLVNELATKSLLCTYLGTDPGSRVYSGSVDKGDSVTVRSVIWFSDIRGFTSLSSMMCRTTLLGLINQVFELTERVLDKYGGEILKFMGDGIMAVFHGTDDEPDSTICHQARMAAYEFQRGMLDLRTYRSSQGLPGGQVQVGIGLHWGEVTYGNVGGTNRLDFTIIGSAVNLASRVEGLTSKLDTDVLATDAFVTMDNIDTISAECAAVGDGGSSSSSSSSSNSSSNSNIWKPYGKHKLKGVADLVQVYELISDNNNKNDNHNVQVVSTDVPSSSSTRYIKRLSGSINDDFTNKRKMTAETTAKALALVAESNNNTYNSSTRSPSKRKRCSFNRTFSYMIRMNKSSSTLPTLVHTYTPSIGGGERSRTGSNSSYSIKNTCSSSNGFHNNHFWPSRPKCSNLSSITANSNDTCTGSFFSTSSSNNNSVHANNSSSGYCNATFSSSVVDAPNYHHQSTGNAIKLKTKNKFLEILSSK